jgi:hypothetical protein
MMDRRFLLQVGSGAGLASAHRAMAARSAQDWGFRFEDNLWNHDVHVRIQGDIRPGTQLHGFGRGTVNGVLEGEKIRPLFGYFIYSSFRMIKNPDNSYQRLLRELILYFDFTTGQFLDEWDNPYTGERVRVVDVANDPFNVVFSEYFPDPPTFGGLNTEKAPRRPLILNWQMWPNDFVVLENDVHLHYPSALRPEQWPRESPGPMTRVSELYRYFIRAADLADSGLTHIPHNGAWTRVTPWLPWMLMDQAPGHILYQGMFTTARGDDELPPALVARVRDKYPKFLVAPETWVDPSLSSLENYQRFQKPAPARKRAP